MNQTKTKIEALGEIVNQISPGLSFTILEVGALPLQDQREEVFHQLVNIFPQSQLIAFEVDKNLCKELNEKSKDNVRYFPVALGRKDETCSFYETEHPACGSLYEPNEALLKNYNNMDVARLKSIQTIDTKSLDGFVNDHDIGPVDFIKIDIQGAELDVFMGGVETLKDVVFIVSEVEFVHLYIGQPLFGDVSKYLTEQNLMFHKFIDLAGRALKPIIMDNDPNKATQQMWGDAVFIPDINKLNDLSPDRLLKMGILSYFYGSPDVAFNCFQQYDKIKNTNLHQRMLDL